MTNRMPELDRKYLEVWNDQLAACQQEIRQELAKARLSLAIDTMQSVENSEFEGLFKALVRQH